MKAKINITIKESPWQTTRILDSGQEFTIGRSPLCVIAIPDKKLSRVHCTFYYDQDAFYLKDNHSTNGTYLNRQRIEEPKKLKDGDIIRMGDSRIEFWSSDKIQESEELGENPEKIDDYEILEEIGGGGIGLVYKVRQIATQTIFAMKILKPEAAEDTTMVSRFMKEARACASLDHPVLVKVYDIGIYQNTPYLVLEYIPGKNLNECIQQNGKMECIPALQITEQLADGLAYCHSLGIIHRDIKPSNILITPEAKVKLVDMGMVKILHEAGITMAGQALGTPRYMPPEQIEDSSTVNHQADIYSLGATLYHMLAGVPPYHEIKTRHLGELLQYLTSQPPIPIENIVESLPKPLVKLIHKAMARDKKDRFADARSFQKEIIQTIKKLKK